MWHVCDHHYGCPYVVIGRPLCFTPVICYYLFFSCSNLRGRRTPPHRTFASMSVWCNFIMQIRGARPVSPTFWGSKSLQILPLSWAIFHQLWHFQDLKIQNSTRYCKSETMAWNYIHYEIFVCGWPSCGTSMPHPVLFLVKNYSLLQIVIFC